MTSDALQLTVHGPLAYITMTRPERRNAFNTTMWRALIDLCETLRTDPNVKVVVLQSSSETAFCAGADISEFDRIRQSQSAASENADLIEGAMAALQTLPRPTVALIDGTCFGGGAALALCCDFRLAGPTARFAITPARLGLSYSVANVTRLVNVTGLQMARRILMLADVLDANTALANNLVDQIAEDGQRAADLLPALQDRLTHLSQFSIRALKTNLQHCADGLTRDTDATRAAFIEAFAGADLNEGMTAFLEKRKPDFPYS